MIGRTNDPGRSARGLAAWATLLVVATLLLAGCSRLSQENFNKIEKGMTFEEVTAILGQPTDSESVGIGPLSGTAASWDDGKTRIEIKFLNEKVQLKSLDSKGSSGSSSSGG